jgi:hypothetical protein
MRPPETRPTCPEVPPSVQLKDVILRAAARLNLPITWVPERLSEQNFNLEDPPTKASPWVGVLLNHLRVFRRSLESLGGITPRDTDQVTLNGSGAIRSRGWGVGYHIAWRPLSA